MNSDVMKSGLDAGENPIITTAQRTVGVHLKTSVKESPVAVELTSYARWREFGVLGDCNQGRVQLDSAHRLCSSREFR